MTSGSCASAATVVFGHQFASVSQSVSLPESKPTAADQVPATCRKEGNFNAVRNSHYPHHPRWYELCDEHGLYVVDAAGLEGHWLMLRLLGVREGLPDDRSIKECNIETHGFVENLAISLLACDWAWREQFLYRTRNMFQRAIGTVWIGSKPGISPLLRYSVRSTYIR